MADHPLLSLQPPYPRDWRFASAKCPHTFLPTHVLPSNPAVQCKFWIRVAGGDIARTPGTQSCRARTARSPVQKPGPYPARYNPYPSRDSLSDSRLTVAPVEFIQHVQRFQGFNMTQGQIHHMDVIADAGTIRRWIIIAPNIKKFSPAPPPPGPRKASNYRGCPVDLLRSSRWHGRPPG